MTHLRRVVLPLRILLAIVFAALLAAQIWAVPSLLPGWRSLRWSGRSCGGRWARSRF